MAQCQMQAQQQVQGQVQGSTRSTSDAESPVNIYFAPRSLAAQNQAALAGDLRGRKKKRKVREPKPHGQPTPLRLPGPPNSIGPIDV